MRQLYCENCEQWHNWLKDNHYKENEIWLLFYKKQSGKSSIDYDNALDEALCFGWIDSIIKKIDDIKYVRKFTRRKESSKWSEENKKRVSRLIESNRMTEAGYAIINAAKANGSWDKPDRPPIINQVPIELQKALKKNNQARRYFKQLAPSYKRQYIMWISMAKKQGTKEERIKESIKLLEKGQKLGLK